MMAGYPSSGEGIFNYHSGGSDDDACSDADCHCIVFVSI